MKIDGFDFSNGLRCSDVQKTEKLINLSSNIFELNLYEDQNKRKHFLVPIETSKNDSDKVIDNLLYKNHYPFIKTLKVFSGDHDKSYELYVDDVWIHIQTKIC